MADQQALFEGYKVETTVAGLRSITDKLKTGEIFVDANGEAQHI